jgi:hypothetical protein
MKYTKKEVVGMFERLAKAMNKRIDGGIYDGLGLDYNSIYGGYVIVEYGDLGSESHPFSCMRRNAKEMYLSMWMTAQALEYIRYKQEQLNRKELAI